MRRVIAYIALALLLAPQVAAAKYTYIHNDGEYSIDLPEAPVGETIWANDGHIPLIGTADALEGAIGEYANFKTADNAGQDVFEVNMIFVKADRAFLKQLTQQSAQAMLDMQMKDTPLDKKTVDYSAGAETLKWAITSGYSVDPQNRLYFNAGHLLVGLDSILFIRIRYTLENKLFNDYYKAATQSIRYVGR